MPALPDDDLKDICGVTGPLWEQCRRARIFLTGGTGFFGTWLVESFLAANNRFGLNSSLTVLTRNPAAFLAQARHLSRETSLEFLEGDVRSFRFPRGPFDFVIHAAASASAKQSEEDPMEMFSTIVAGTERVLEFSRQSAARSVLFTSSGAVYGIQPPSISHICEEYQGAPDPLRAASVYGEAKRSAEQLCSINFKQHGLKTKIARCFAFVGPHLPLNAHFAIGNFMSDAMNHQDIQILGDGTPKRSYLYASDLMVWLWTILFMGTPCFAYNVGSEDALSILELAEVAVSALDPKLKISVRQQPEPGAQLQQYVPSTGRAKAQLGLKQRVDLRNAISKTAMWHGFQRCSDY